VAEAARKGGRQAWRAASSTEATCALTCAPPFRPPHRRELRACRRVACDSPEACSEWAWTAGRDAAETETERLDETSQRRTGRVRAWHREALTGQCQHGRLASLLVWAGRRVVANMLGARCRWPLALPACMRGKRACTRGSGHRRQGTGGGRDAWRARAGAALVHARCAFRKGTATGRLSTSWACCTSCGCELGAAAKGMGWERPTCGRTPGRCKVAQPQCFSSCRQHTPVCVPASCCRPAALFPGLGHCGPRRWSSALLPQRTPRPGPSHLSPGVNVAAGPAGGL
jgi:hypothetical protein